MDRHELGREFHFVVSCREIAKTTDVEALQRLAIGLLRQNMAIRDYVRLMVEQEIALKP